MQSKTQVQIPLGWIIHSPPLAVTKEAGSHPLGVGLHALKLGWFPSAKGHTAHRAKWVNECILIFCVKGRGWFEIDGTRRSLGASEVLLIPGKKPHAYGADKNDPWSIYWIHFLGNDSPSYCNLLPPQENIVCLGPREAAEVEKLFSETCHLLSEGHTGRKMLLVAHILKHLLGLIFFQSGVGTRGLKGVVGHDLSKSIQFMSENITRPLSLKELSRHSGLSPARYSFLFSQQTGMSPVEHHIRLRMQAACHWLDTSTASVKEVAGKLGYQDQYYFSRIFRKMIGCSPLTYRRSPKG